MLINAVTKLEKVSRNYCEEMGGDVVLVKVVLQGTHTYTHTHRKRERQEGFLTQNVVQMLRLLTLHIPRKCKRRLITYAGYF